VLDEEGVDEGNRDRAEQGARHERPPVEDVAAHQFGEDPDRDRLLPSDPTTLKISQRPRPLDAALGPMNNTSRGEDPNRRK
jgi:hypothetical protein